MPLVNPVAGGMGGLLAGLMGGAGGIAGGFGSLLGLGGGLGGGIAGNGLGGVFGALLGQVSAGQAADVPLAQGQLAALLAQLKNVGASPLPDELFAIADSGEMVVDLQQVMVQLTVTVSELKAANVNFQNLGSAGELADAYVQLGMTPEEAALKATQIETMLQLVREMLGVATAEDATTGNLLAMVAAQASTSLTPMAAEHASVQVTTVELEVRTAVSHTVVAQPAARAFGPAASQGVDLARAVAGIGSGHATAARRDASGDAVAVGVEAIVVDELAEDAVMSAPAVSGQVAVAMAAAGVVKDADTAVSAKKDDGVQGIGRHESVPARMAPVLVPAERAEIQAPVGLEVARLVDDNAGGAVMERKVPAAQLREMAPAPAPQPAPAPAGGETMAAPVAMAKTADGQPVTAFAERLAHATRSEVSQHTVVQVKGLADQGGGVVRMLLNPPELGEIRIEITVSGGRVEGAISATDGAVVELLARDVHMLRQGLADAGLKLGEQGLSLMLGNNQQQGQGQGFGQHPQQQGQQHAAPVVWEGDDPTGDAAQAAGWMDVNKLVDVNV